MKKMVFLMMTAFLLSSCLVSKNVVNSQLNSSRSVNSKTGLYGSGNKIPKPIKQKIKK